MSTGGKRKVSLSLDSALVAALEADGPGLSARVNAALWKDLAARHHQRRLAALLDRLAAERGPLDTAEDEVEIARFMSLLGEPDEDHPDRATVGAAG